MSRSTNDLAPRQRLARLYRRLLLLCVPAALAACQGGEDALAPETSDAAGEVAVPAAGPSFSVVAAGQILFASEVAEEEADLFAMGPNGGNVTHLTSMAGSELFPAWSPDHKRIAFQRARNGKLDVFIMNADGTNKHWAMPTQSPTFSLTMPSWSPDGTKLLVQLRTGPTGTAYVGRINLATGILSLLAPAGQYSLAGTYPIYSKDGAWIYYVDGSGRQLHRFQPGGSDVYLETYAGNVCDLSLSPDGTRIAFDLYYLTDREIGVKNLITHVTTWLTDVATNEIDPTWSPDGSLLAFVSDRSGKWQIYTMNASNGGNVHKLTNKANGAVDPSWY